VAGQAAGLYDVTQTAGHDMVAIIPVAAAAIALLLGLVLRSLIAPFYLVASVVLSYLAAIGLTTLLVIDLGGQDGLIFVLPFLHALYGVGTDLTVTQPPKQGSSPATAFGFTQDIKDIRSGVIAAGTKINISNLSTVEYGILGPSALAAVARQPGVTGAVGGLTLTDATVTGTVPSISAGQGAASYKSSFTTNSFSVEGVDLSNRALGPLSAGRITSGSVLTRADADSDDALVDADYAAQSGLHVNGTVDVGGTNFRIVGVLSAPQGGNPPDVYIPLARAQSIGKNGSASLARDVDTIYVTAASAADITAVQNEISRALPSATVTDSSDLASEVTGSLNSASSLADNLGRWLSVAVLIAAFLLASLLTMTAVTRRVREFGTLKALGWPSRRIVGQVIGESVVIGVAGGAAGVALGFGGAALIDRLAPPLSATVVPNNAASVTGSGRVLGTAALKALSSYSHTVSVTLTAPVTAELIGLAVVLAVAGGLIAGVVGGWRAARLRPAAALARVE
jgi:putative ABC transport system permease protein